ncbi:MAG TPA: glycoside hydrolase family 3 C-terminal domain-containing protein [Rhodanobacteraceae bacterium]
MKTRDGLAGSLACLLLATWPVAWGNPAFAKPPQNARDNVLKQVQTLPTAALARLLGNAQPAVPALHAPAYNWWSEGLHGVARAGYATVFPEPIGLAATWDPALIGQVGRAVGHEARGKYNDIGPDAAHGRYQGVTLWAPVINLARDPRWGRVMETYGEDPLLTSRLASAYVEGVQGDSAHPVALATAKHFLAYSGPEPGRFSFDVDVSRRELTRTYLPAFKQLVQGAQVGSVMCSYSAVHGVPSCANKPMLDGLLRKTWGFRGVVVSDCDAVADLTSQHHYVVDPVAGAVAAFDAGTDIDCGHSYDALAQAVQQGKVTREALVRRVVKVLDVRRKLGVLTPEPNDPRAKIRFDADTLKQHYPLAWRAAAESLVLLKNRDHTLPLKAHGHLKIAVVGPTADNLRDLEGNYHGTIDHPVTPLTALRKTFGHVNIHYAEGASFTRGVPVVIPDTALRSNNGRAGLAAVYANRSGKNSTVVHRVDRHIDFDWNQVAPAQGISAARFGTVWTGTLTAPASGQYTLVFHVHRCYDCQTHDKAGMQVGRAQVGLAEVDQRGDVTLKVHLQAGQPTPIRITLDHASGDSGARLEWIAPPGALLAAARKVIAQSDVVVAFVGSTPVLENEASPYVVPGYVHGDRTSIDLPRPQRQLLKLAKQEGKPLVVVLMSGSSVALRWAKAHADAIVAAWYPGEAGGPAIAAMLAGVINPSGHLPLTFYASDADLQPYNSYSMQGRTYRFFDKPPLYPFGYGLSYTSFAFSGMHVDDDTASGQPRRLQVTVHVANTGKRKGSDVVQIYLRYPASLHDVPLRKLVGFKRVTLTPGQSLPVKIDVPLKRLRHVDKAGNWQPPGKGQYTLYAADSSDLAAPGVLSATWHSSGDAK